MPARGQCTRMWEGRAQSRCRCGRGEPSPDADVARGEPNPGADVEMGGVSPVLVQTNVSDKGGC